MRLLMLCAIALMVQWLACAPAMRKMASRSAGSKPFLHFCMQMSTGPKMSTGPGHHVDGPGATCRRAPKCRRARGIMSTGSKMSTGPGQHVDGLQNVDGPGATCRRARLRLGHVRVESKSRRNMKKIVETWKKIVESWKKIVES